MPTPSRKGVLVVLLVVFLAVIGGEYLQKSFGISFERYWMAAGTGILLLTVFYLSDISRLLRPGATPSKPDRFNIPPGAATRRQINLAREAIKEAEPEQALRHLSDLKVSALDNEIAVLSSRYAEYRRSSRQGIDSRDEENRAYNRITKDILDLIKTLESELATGAENYQIIKDYLKKRYTNRLSQKLAKRQPVNLRRIPSTKGTSDDRAAAFIPYSSDEVAGTMAQNFRDAHGRLLLIGAPGAGKTSLLLQLVLDLLDSEPDALPVLLNLATWSSKYNTLEAWLKKILPPELGVSEKYAQEIMQQDRLILLLDGFDEIGEDDRTSCLEAIGRYGENAQRQYVISSRIQEYKAVAKDAPVYWQIEVGALSIKQLKEELKRLWEHENQPEARVLLQAIQKDPLLREAAETPFYFNTLQILFGGGKTLADLHFTADTLEGRQTEILERFIEYELEAPAQKEYPPEKIKHWLSFLASRMAERNMVVFELRDLQYGWWKLWSRNQLFVAGIAFGFIFFGLTSIALGFLFGLLIGVSLWPNEPNFWPTLIMILGCLIPLSLIFLFGIIGWNGVVFQIREKGGLKLTRQMLFESSKIPTSLSILIVVYLISDNASINYVVLIGVLTWFFFFLLNIFTLESKYILQVGSPYQRFKSSAKRLYFSIIPHWHLLYIMDKKGFLPFKLVPFLNALSLRHILEFDGDPLTGKGGGAWRFRHRILQEWFAEKWVEPEEKAI